MRRALEDRVVLITGAGGGIGAALAQALHAEGARLALVDVTRDGLEAVAASLGGPSSRLSLHAHDVTGPWAPLRDAVVACHGGLDVLVHNAGVTVHGPFAEQPLADLEWLLDVNLRAVVRGTHTLLPLLRASEAGQVVLLSSMSALFGTPLQATYCASKAALRGLGGALRVELGAEGIGVTTVLPGTIATRFLSHARSSEPDESAWMTRQMLAWGTRPETVARRIVHGLRWNRRELRVGWDCVAMDLVQRYLPWFVPNALALAWRYRPRWSR